MLRPGSDRERASSSEPVAGRVVASVLRHCGQGNQIAVQRHRYRETSKRWPTGDDPEVVVAFPPEDDIAEIPTTWSKTAHSFKNGPTK
jgi:hypothetical protein